MKWMINHQKHTISVMSLVVEAAGLVKVQGNRNGDSYHQVMQDLVLDFFPNPKPQNYWLYRYCFICSWGHKHYEARGDTLLCADGIVTLWPWFCVTASLRLLLWFFFWLLDLSQFKHRQLWVKCSHQLQAMIQLGAESWRQKSDGAFAQNDVWQPPWKGFGSGHCLDSICICMFVVLSKTAKNED